VLKCVLSSRASFCSSSNLLTAAGWPIPYTQEGVYIAGQE
jgi:hypothetical protein